MGFLEKERNCCRDKFTKQPIDFGLTEIQYIVRERVSAISTCTIYARIRGDRRLVARGYRASNVLSRHINYRFVQRRGEEQTYKLWPVEKNKNRPLRPFGD